MGAVIGTLAELGYGYAWRVLDAQFFGVPQLRRRVFIVGHLGEPWSAPATVLFEPESCSGSPPARGQEEPGDDASPPLGAGSGREVVAALTGTGVGTCGADDNQAQAGHLVIGSSFGSELARTLTAPANGPRFDYETENLVAYGVSENQRAEFRLTEYSRQITTGGGKPGQGYPAALVNGAVRRLTPIECERLQGFPDDWTLPLHDSPRYRVLGNAVAVPVVQWIVRRLRDHALSF